MRAALIISCLAALAGQARADALFEDQAGDVPHVGDDAPEDPTAERKVPVQVHILASEGGTEATTEARARELIDALAQAYVDTGTPFVFELAGIDKVIVPEEDVGLLKDSRTAEKLPEREHNATPHVLHLYLMGTTCKTGNGGWSYLPGNGTNAVFVRANMDISDDVLVHEVGHWLGLYHVHEGGCGNDDGVKDTPAQEAPPSEGDVDRCAPDYMPRRFDCTAPVDSCPRKDGLDSTDNYMSYFAGCMQTFTTGQVDRMIKTWDKYRAPDDKADGMGSVEETEPVGCQAGPGGGGALVGLGILGMLSRRRRRG